jgi:hypothetical protein
VRALGLALACCLLAAGGASAAPPPPADLGVDGGQETWRASRTFRIHWSIPAANPAVVAVHYRVRDPAGATVVGPVRLPWAARDVDGIQVPPLPGAYTAEVWLEDWGGQLSGPASAVLRFDDERPGATTATAGSAWLGRTGFPLPLRLERPARVPLSGIRGYAVSLSADPNRPPCAAPLRCSATETDLSGGVEDIAFVVADLPEGTTYLRAVAVSGSGVASADPGPIALRVDKTAPATALRGVPAGWTDRPVELTATAVDGGSGMLPAAGGVEPFTAISVDGGRPIAAPGASATTTVAAEGVHRVAHYARDLAGNVDDGAAGNGVPNPPPPTALVRIDRTPPSVSFADAQGPDAPETIRARVEDSLSGPDPARGWIGVRRRGSGDPFAALPAGPAPPGELRAHWDSEAYPDGEYEFRAIASDRAGNAAATTRRANGSEMVLANPVKERTSLSLELAGGSASERALPFGRAVPLRGTLRSGSRPLASKRVEVVERYGEGAPRVTTVETGADGGFALRLAAGPSREVSAAFAGGETLTRAAAAPLRLRVRAEVRMKTSASVARVGGPPLLFAGRVSAAPGALPAEGKAVELQFRLPGLPWTEFRTIQTDRRGRFRYRYRFSDDDSRGVRFLFRAYAPAQGGWPYEPSGSRPVAVRGR